MSTKDVTVSLSKDLNVSSIQVTINQIAGGEISVSKLPEYGTFIRQAFPPEPGTVDPVRIRITYIPDDRTQIISSIVQASDPGEKAEWEKILEAPSGLDIDNGVATAHMDEQGGRATWLPNEIDEEVGSHVFKQKTLEEPNGASIGDFIACWVANGRNAAAFSHCISKL